MQRRDFLRLGACGAMAMSLPMVSQRVWATEMLPLNLPERLQGNPLLNFSGLPDFATVRPDHVKPAIEFLLQYSINAVETLSAQKNVTWQNFYLPLEEAQDKLDRAWSVVGHLHSVKNSDALREAYREAQKMLTEYHTWFGMYRPLYEAFLKLKNAKAYKSYTKVQKKAIDNALLDFQLSGVALKGEKAKRYGEIVARLSELSTQFGNNVLDANMGWALVVEDEARLAGITEMALASAKKSAEDKGVAGYRFGLDYPSYFAVAAYADDRELRHEMFHAYRTRASDQGPTAGQWDNSAIMREILALRLELAQLLDYQTYADYALVRRMAESPKQVLDFLSGLLSRTHDKARAEVADLAAYGKAAGLIDELQPWDVAYLSEKQKQDKYSIDKEALRVYFPEKKVLSGMFSIAKSLFGIDIEPRQGVSVWHEDVRFFDVKKDGVHIASFYLDMYAREHKRGGAWMNSTIERRVDANGVVQLPLTQVVCNFSAPVAGKPSLLLHDEVETLFHEFGHALHHMLTVVDVMAVSGINGVAWDAVEFPSQMLENWTWDAKALALIAEHYETGEPLPQEMMDKMLSAKNYLAAYGLVRQLELGLFDMRINTEYQAGDDGIIERVRDDIKQNIAVVPDPEWTRMVHSFTHIFAGGYAAGYYSYLWADVLASDAYSRFEAEGILNAAVGQAYVDAFLGQGGSDSPMAMFRAFMGRDPKPDALLRQRGIL